MAGYTRNDTSNNIATGNVINAADLDGEFDALVAAFHASTGHTHDGTAANGAPITKIGPVQDLVISTGAITPKTDNTVDLGSSSFEFKDLYIDGTANIDALVADTADINAGTIDGVVIGGSTTAAGSFTTLTTSSTVTLNGGTANGVLYLNGSKVATSGSALTFDGTNLGVGIASVAAAGTTIHVHGSTDSSLRLTNTTTGTGTSNGFKLQANGPDAYLVNYSNGFMAFYTNATEQMRLTSTGLGIGTSSPATKLHVAGTGAFGATGTDGAISIRRGADGVQVGSITLDNTSAWLKLGTGYGTLIFNANGTDRLTIDPSGNLGLGVTPSAWDSSVLTALQVRSASISSVPSGANDAYFSSNAFYNASWKYINTALATQYRQVNGVHSWHTAPSGTAGNAITFTQAMTLDASGRLGVGATSPTVLLDVQSQSNTADYYACNITSIAAASGESRTWLRIQKDSNYGGAIAGYLTQGVGGGMIFGVLSGSSTPTERARITSGGDLLVGTTDAGATSGVGFKVTSSATIPGTFTVFNTAGGGNTYHLYNTNATNNGYRFYVGVNGGISNYQANDTNLSDIRKKTDIQPAGSYLDKICAIPVKTFLYKDQSDTDRNLGVIAQDVDAVAPELVDRNGFGETPEGESPYLSIYQTDLQYALMKCIQEQQALITSLTARVALLEGN